MRTVLSRMKLGFGLLAGLVICKLGFLYAYKKHLLSTWQTPEKKSGVDRVFYPGVLAFWFRFEYLLEKDPDQRELMKELLMGRDNGRAWAKYYDDQPLDLEGKIGHMGYAEAWPVLVDLDKRLKEIPGPVLVVQIGSSSGREIAWLAQRNPAHRYVGTDIYPEIIAYAAQKHVLQNLDFQVCSAQGIAHLLMGQAHQPLVVFSSGSLQYVQPEHMQSFFDAIGKVPGLEIFLVEPANEIKGKPEGFDGSSWRGNFSYTHNYEFYAKRAGFTTLSRRIIRPYVPYEDFPVHRGTVHYYYIGKKER